MIKQKTIKHKNLIALAALAAGVGVAGGAIVENCSAVSVAPLTTNPDYIQYQQSVQAGHGSDWKVIPSPYLTTGIAESTSSLQANSLPTSYDLRSATCGSGTCATRVKDQGAEGICWAYSTTTVMESTLLKTAGVKTELSPKQLDYLSASPATALTDSTTNGYYSHLKSVGIDRTLGYGGNFEAASYTIGSNVGPTLEDTFFAGLKANDSRLDSFSSYEEVAAVGKYNVPMPSGLVFAKSKTDNYVADKTVDYTLTTSSDSATRAQVIQQIKQHIMKYGAMSVGTYFTALVPTSTCWDAASKTIIDRGSTVCDSTYGHALSVIGWDDNYSYYDSVAGTTKKGAFLLQNSWGESTDYTYVHMAYDYNLGIGGITSAKQNEWDAVYDQSVAQSTEGLTRADNEVVAKYHATGKQTINQISLVDFYQYTVTGDFWKVYISPTGNEADYQEVGTINVDTPLAVGRRAMTLDTNGIEVTGDFLVKVQSQVQGLIVLDAMLPLFTINAYATGEVGPAPAPTPDDPGTGDNQLGDVVGAPNTGFAKTGAIIATVIAVPSAIAAGFGIRAIYRRLGHQVRFKK